MSLLRRFASWLLNHVEDMLVGDRWVCEFCSKDNTSDTVRCAHCGRTDSEYQFAWGSPEDIRALFLEEFPPGDPADLPF